MMADELIKKLLGDSSDLVINSAENWQPIIDELFQNLRIGEKVDESIQILDFVLASSSIPEIKSALSKIFSISLLFGMSENYINFEFGSINPSLIELWKMAMEKIRNEPRILENSLCLREFLESVSPSDDVKIDVVVKLLCCPITRRYLRVYLDYKLFSVKSDKIRRALYSMPYDHISSMALSVEEYLSLNRTRISLLQNLSFSILGPIEFDLLTNSKASKSEELRTFFESLKPDELNLILDGLGLNLTLQTKYLVDGLVEKFQEQIVEWVDPDNDCFLCQEHLLAVTMTRTKILANKRLEEVKESAIYDLCPIISDSKIETTKSSSTAIGINTMNFLEKASISILEGKAVQVFVEAIIDDVPSWSNLAVGDVVYLTRVGSEKGRFSISSTVQGCVSSFETTSHANKTTKKAVRIALNDSQVYSFIRTL